VVEQLRKKLMTTKGIFKLKTSPDGTIKYKARFISRGFVHYLELIIQSHLHQFDLEVAFRDALLTDPVYIKWPKGLKQLSFLSKQEYNDKCAELTRAMYGNIDLPYSNG
jgi:hypothetical protein